MKVLVGIAGGWIGFSLADKALFDGGMTRTLILLASRNFRTGSPESFQVGPPLLRFC